MNQLHLCNPNHMKSTQLHHHPQSHGIHNQKKKKSRQNLHASPLVDLIGEAKLHGNGQSQWQRSRRRKKQKERQRKMEEKEKRE